MTVLYLKDTQHVLAAVSRTTDPARPPTVADLAPAGLRARAVGTVFRTDVTVEAARLAAATVPADPAVLTDPRAFSVTPGGKPSVERLTTVTPTIAITAGQVDVTVINAVAGLKVLLVLGKAGGPAPEVLTGALTAGPATFAVNLGKGVWRAVAFVAGRPPAAKEVTIT
jgi:hypothetical protein